MASALRLDTLAFTKRLREAGADERLAEAIVEGLTAADTSELATKADVAGVEGALKADVATLKAELTAEIATATNRAIYTLGGLIGVLFVIDRLLPLFAIGG